MKGLTNQRIQTLATIQREGTALSHIRFFCDPMDFCDSMDYRFLCPWDMPGKNNGMGCHFLLQGIFPTHGSNPHLLHWQVDSLPLRKPTWVALGKTVNSVTLLWRSRSSTFWVVHPGDTPQPWLTSFHTRYPIASSSSCLHQTKVLGKPSSVISAKKEENVIMG